MSDPGKMILLAFQLLVGSPGDVDATNADISIQRSSPPTAEQRQAMNRWQAQYLAQMTPVFHAWSSVVAVIHEGRMDELPRVCRGLQQSLARLDRGALLTAPDPVVRTWIGKSLGLLDSAAGHGLRGRVFALDFRLDRARRLLTAVDRRLESYQ